MKKPIPFQLPVITVEGSSYRLDLNVILEKALHKLTKKRERLQAAEQAVKDVAMHGMVADVEKLKDTEKARANFEALYIARNIHKHLKEAGVSADEAVEVLSKTASFGVHTKEIAAAIHDVMTDIGDKASEPLKKGMQELSEGLSYLGDVLEFKKPDDVQETDDEPDI